MNCSIFLQSVSPFCDKLLHCWRFEPATYIVTCSTKEIFIEGYSRNGTGNNKGVMDDRMYIVISITCLKRVNALMQVIDRLVHR